MSRFGRLKTGKLPRRYREIGAEVSAEFRAIVEADTGLTGEAASDALIGRLAEQAGMTRDEAREAVRQLQRRGFLSRALLP